MPSNQLIFCRPLLLLPSIFPSIRVFSNESVLCIRWRKYWSFSFSINPSNVYPGFITFKIDLISLQNKGLSRVFSNTTIQKHQFFSAQPSFWSDSHIDIWLLEKPLTLTIWAFLSKVMSLLFNMLSRFLIVFLPRSKHLFISWLQSLSTVILAHRKRKSVTASTFFPFYLPWSNGTGCHDLNFFLMVCFKLAFSLFSFTPMKRLFSSYSLSTIRSAHLWTDKYFFEPFQSVVRNDWLYALALVTTNC